MNTSAASRIHALPAEEHARQLRRAESGQPAIWDLLDQVKDPEIPAVSIWELGILQDIAVDEAGAVTVTITPTYSGCPAMDTIREDIEAALAAAGYSEVKVALQLSPAWSTSWLSAAARRKLTRFGIAAPDHAAGAGGAVCPQCQSADVHLLSEFGSTSCKALYQCDSCHEAFDYFKPF